MTPQTEIEIMRIQERMTPKLIQFACIPPLIMAVFALLVAGIIFLREARPVKIYAVSQRGQVANVNQIDGARLSEIRARVAK